MTDAPPTRYRVVERGRRLVVIDTLTGQPATRELAVHESKAVAPATRPVEASAPSAVDDRSGHAVLTTSRFYDLKAPRRIVWEAMTSPDKMKRWMLPPPGWTLSSCEVDARLGGTLKLAYRFSDSLMSYATRHFGQSCRTSRWATTPSRLLDRK